LAEIETLVGEFRFAEVCLGDFPDEKEVIRNYPGLKGVRIESFDDGNGVCVSSCRALIDLDEFDAYISEVECLILDMEDHLKGMIGHREMLQAGMFLEFPEMFRGESFVGYYGSICEAKKDYSLRTMWEGDTKSFREVEVRDRRGNIRKETEIDIAYFANREEVERMVEKEGWDILHKSNEIKEKKEFLQRLKRIRRDNHVM
jgi:hypothetical protein